MSLNTTIVTDSDFSGCYVDSSEFQMPDIPGSEFAFFLGSSLGLRLSNLIAGKPDATEVGTVIDNGTSITVDQSNYILTDLSEFTQGTLCGIFTQPSHAGSIISTYRQPVSGVWLACHVVAPYKPIGRALTSPTNNGTVLASTFPVGAVEFVASILDATSGVQSIYHPRTGSSFQFPIGARSVVSADKFRIGSAPVPGAFDDVSAGQIDVSFAHASTTPLSFGQINSLYAPVKRWIARRAGIVI